MSGYNKVYQDGVDATLADAIYAILKDYDLNTWNTVLNDVKEKLAYEKKRREGNATHIYECYRASNFGFEQKSEGTGEIK